MKRLVVIGGGVSGLAAAHGARAIFGESQERFEVVVLERETRIGGKVRSHDGQGWLVEEGPTGYLDNEPAVDRLVAIAGLEKVPANEAAARRFIVRGGRMREVHAHPLKLARSGLLSPLGLLRCAAEPLIKRGPSGTDESIFDFAARRCGRQVAERLIAPMVLGVFAGDARRLALRSAFPMMAEMEEQHGSLVRAMLAKRKEAKAAGKTAGGPSGPSGTLTTFPGGLEALPRALADAPGLDVRCSTEVRDLFPRPDGGYVLALDGQSESLDADAVVLAGETWASAKVLDAASPTAARALSAVPTPPVAVVALGFGPEALGKVPRGFGVLIPRNESFRILGCLWDTHLFPGRSPEGHLLVRCMLGGAVDTEVGGLYEEELVEIARRDLERLSGINTAPVYRHVTLWKRAIPQYTAGHATRVAAVEKALASLPGVYVAGNGLHGIAFGKAIAAGLAEGERAARFLLDQERGR